MTKPKILTEIAALCSAGLLLMSAGCLNTDQREELRDAAHSVILAYVEMHEQANAIKYIDQLVADGKLDAANAERLKAAIPLGIEKLKELMGELEKEGQENE